MPSKQIVDCNAFKIIKSLRKKARVTRQQGSMKTKLFVVIQLSQSAKNACGNFVLWYGLLFSSLVYSYVSLFNSKCAIL